MCPEGGSGSCSTLRCYCVATPYGLDVNDEMFTLATGYSVLGICRAKRRPRNTPENLSIWSVFALIIAPLPRFFFLFFFFFVSWKSSGRFRRFISFHALHRGSLRRRKEDERKFPFDRRRIFHGLRLIWCLVTYISFGASSNLIRIVILFLSCKKLPFHFSNVIYDSIRES